LKGYEFKPELLLRSSTDIVYGILLDTIFLQL